MSGAQDGFVHLVAGASGGTVGAIVTCPLEVIKTRLQSSAYRNMAWQSPSTNHGKFPSSSPMPNKSCNRKVWTSAYNRSQVVHLSQLPSGGVHRSVSLYHCFRHIIEVEGPRALWKGLLPNLVGVAPSRAIYFCTYSQMKKSVVANMGIHEDSSIVHIISAAGAGFSACTLTNPIWFIKTRLQLDQNILGKKLGTWQCIKRIYKDKGILGFYKGMTASYYGISETVIHLAIYEFLKLYLRQRRSCQPNDEKSGRDFAEFMLAGACSKTVASMFCYPHEVARTRLREEGKKYVGFWQTLALVLKEEGWAGLYAGLGTQLVRQIPNTAIMMATYEGVVYMLTSRESDEDDYFEEYED